MDSKNQVTFDELDKKYFDEFPFIMDLLISTENKISEAFLNYYDEVLEYVEENLPKNWEIVKTEPHKYAMFTWRSMYKTIRKLDNLFVNEHLIYLKQKKEKNKNELIVLAMGHYYDIIENKQINTLYIDVTFRTKKLIKSHNYFNSKKIEEKKYSDEIYYESSVDETTKRVETNFVYYTKMLSNKLS